MIDKQRLTSIVGLLTLFVTLQTSSAAPQAPNGICAETGTDKACADQVLAKGPWPSAVVPGAFHPGHYLLLGPSTPRGQIDLLSEYKELVGVKRMYNWRDLEPRFGQFDFSEIESDLARVKKYGKQLFIQIRPTQYNSARSPNIPEDMWDQPKYGCGTEHFGVFRRETKSGGWIPCYWNEEVSGRYAALLEELGRRYGSDTNIEGISMDETAIDVNAAKLAAGYSVQGLEAGYKKIALAAKRAFVGKTVMQLVNHAPFDLNEFADWLAKSGIGIGGPDLKLMESEATLHEVYAKYREHHAVVPTGPNAEWDNYSRNKLSGNELVVGAVDMMNPWYIFWIKREPYFTDEVLPALTKGLPAAKQFYAGTAGNLADAR